uniref:Uncharacterized protein n=1 Tax=Plectus sambesii TaxID=2011161 RepID=A0A914UHA9_9BILA
MLASSADLGRSPAPHSSSPTEEPPPSVYALGRASIGPRADRPTAVNRRLRARADDDEDEERATERRAWKLRSKTSALDRIGRLISRPDTIVIARDRI